MEMLDDLFFMVVAYLFTPHKARSPGLPMFLYEFTFDTTRALVNTLYQKTYVKHLEIRRIRAHAGGTLLQISYRTVVLYRRLFFDTALGPGAVSA